VSRYTETEAALLALLATVSGVPTTATPNTRFAKVVSTPWMTAQFAPQEETLRTKTARDGRMRLTGVLRLKLYYPPLAGDSAALAMAEAILTAFAPGTTLTNGATTVHLDSGSRMWMGGTDIEPGWYTVPIDLRWHVDFINALP
jgi:hypothetical protein